MVQMYHPLFDEGHLGCFQFLVILNRAAMNICVQVFVQIEVCIL